MIVFCALTASNMKSTCFVLKESTPLIVLLIDSWAPNNVIEWLCNSRDKYDNYFSTPHISAKSKTNSRLLSLLHNPWNLNLDFWSLRLSFEKLCKWLYNAENVFHTIYTALRLLATHRTSRTRPTFKNKMSNSVHEVLSSFWFLGDLLNNTYKLSINQSRFCCYSVRLCFRLTLIAVTVIVIVCIHR